MSLIDTSADGSIRSGVDAPPVDLAIDLAPQRPGRLALRNPLMAAAGCVGYGLEAAEHIDLGTLGAIVTRGTTLTARDGSPAPRMVDAAGGLLHAIGLQNPGIDAVLERFATRWASWPVPIILSVAGPSADDFGTLASRVELPGVAGLELDLASVELTNDGRPISLDPAAAARATASARAATDLPLLAKLSPAAGDIRAVARAVVEAGADALTCGGGLPAASIDRDDRRPMLGSGRATLSGPAIRPITLRVVAEVNAAVKVPVVGCGGVTTLGDVVDLLMAGASAVQVGTAMLADPELPGRLAGELAAYCRDEGLASHRDLVGVAAMGRRRSR